MWSPAKRTPRLSIRCLRKPRPSRIHEQLLAALAEVEDPGLARRMLEIAFGHGPPAGSGPYLVLSLASTHPDLVWDLALPHLQDRTLPLENDIAEHAMPEITRWVSVQVQQITRSLALP